MKVLRKGGELIGGRKFAFGAGGGDGVFRFGNEFGLLAQCGEEDVDFRELFFEVFLFFHERGEPVDRFGRGVAGFGTDVEERNGLAGGGVDLNRFGQETEGEAGENEFVRAGGKLGGGGAGDDGAVGVDRDSADFGRDFRSGEGGGGEEREGENGGESMFHDEKM